MSTEHVSGQVTIVGGFDSPDKARAAMRSAGLRGIDGDHLVLDRATSSIRPRRRGVDRRLTAWISRRVFAASLGGSVLGAVVALVVTSVLGSTATTIWESAVLSALAGFVVGFLFGGISAFPLTPALADTFEEDQGALRLVVRTSSPDEEQAAVQALQAAGAAWVNREE